MNSNAPALVRWSEGPASAERWFPTLRDAARFVVEQLDPAFRHSASIISGGGHLTIGEITFFYRCICVDRGIRADR
jgi:hypothetical protein